MEWYSCSHKLLRHCRDIEGLFEGAILRSKWGGEKKILLRGEVFSTATIVFPLPCIPKVLPVGHFLNP